MPDHEGKAPGDLAEAKCEAVKLAGRMMCNDADSFWDKKELSLAVTDVTGLTLFQLLIIGTEAAASMPPPAPQSLPAHLPESL
ncbi:MAG TPA: hypothetical protein VEZ41_02105 [Allosphingosinicella sp.]|nr:hypothetical protein [Allosphingosinicella sp.]